jgi:hypothetical protein
MPQREEVRMRKLEGGSKQIIDIAKNENLPLQVIQLDVDNDKSNLLSISHHAILKS